MIHATKLARAYHLASFMCAAQDEAVVDEEFAAQNEEQDDAGDDVGGIVVQRVGREAISDAPRSRKTSRKEISDHHRRC